MMPAIRRALSPRLPRVLKRQRRHRSRRIFARWRSSPGQSEGTQPGESPTPAQAGVNWRRNLAALWVAEFFAIFGFSFAFPFLPPFLHEDLGVQSQQQLAFWTGLCSGVGGLSMAVASPIWGSVADRYGRRQMLVRAMVAGAITVLLMGLCHAAWQMAALRFLQGATSGTVAAATTLVATETPRRKVAWALGVLSSSIALGGAVGPMVGGLAATFFGLRLVFVCGGLLLLLAVLPVLLMVRETPRSRPVAERRPSTRATLRLAGGGTMAALLVLLVAQGLMQFSNVSAQQMAVLRILRLDPGTANLVTGMAFGLAGVATAVASATSARFARRFGYRALAAASAFLLALVIGASALVPSVLLIVAGVMATGLLVGYLGPTLNSMIGLETPPEVQATVFGFSSSAISLGLAVGPMLAGIVAAATNPSMALLVAAAVSVVLSVVLAVGSRDPGAAQARVPSQKAV